MIKRELEAETPVHIEETINKKSTATTKWANGMKINLLHIEKTEKLRKWIYENEIPVEQTLP